MIFLSDRMFLSANADLISLSVVYKWIPFFSQNFLKSPLNSDPLSVHTFSGCFFLIIFWTLQQHLLHIKVSLVELVSNVIKHPQPLTFVLHRCCVAKLYPYALHQQTRIHLFCTQELSVGEIFSWIVSILCTGLSTEDSKQFCLW